MHTPVRRLVLSFERLDEFIEHLGQWDGADERLTPIFISKPIEASDEKAPKAWRGTFSIYCAFPAFDMMFRLVLKNELRFEAVERLKTELKRKVYSGSIVLNV